MIEFITYKWHQPNYRSHFLPQHVNTLRNMIERNYTAGPWRFSCITDDPKGIDSRIRIIPLWSDHATLQNPSRPGGPSCYRRLKMFSKEAEEFIGERICSLDIDIVITGNINHIVNNGKDFKMWGDTHSRTDYNGSLAVFDAGCRSQIWETFHPKESPKRTLKLGMFGSDQAWISCCLGPTEAKFGKEDGVYSFRNHILPSKNRHKLPDNACMIIMHGWLDPWSQEVSQLSWVKEHYK